MSVFIIAEAGSSHDNDLQKAYRLIEAAKECGADAVKFQWTSDFGAMARRRAKDPKDVGALALMYEAFLFKSEEWLYALHEKCLESKIEFMCTVYLLKDIPIINKFVKRFKISAYESQWFEFVDAHDQYGKEVIISLNGTHVWATYGKRKFLHCVSKYPTPINELGLGKLWHRHGNGKSMYDGLSDHSGDRLVGGFAAAAGADIIEAHIRLHDTSPANPDYGHSLICDLNSPPMEAVAFREYVGNIRYFEKMV